MIDEAQITFTLINHFRSYGKHNKAYNNVILILHLFETLMVCIFMTFGIRIYFSANYSYCVLFICF